MKLLPLKENLESVRVLKKLISAHKYLAELKSSVKTIPNEEILINTLSLQEAKASSEIENIITTHDELYSETDLDDKLNFTSKEVQYYAQAVKKGFSLIKENNLLTVNMVCEIHEILEKNKAGFRRTPGTTLKNALTNEVVYTPPQDHQQIVELMNNLEFFINDQSSSDLDPLIKMAVIHHQFESIHPFYDGNGRVGRIINILYLIINDLQTLPILYLSRYIIANKSQYYQLLNDVRENNVWEEWILFILDGVEKTAKQTVSLVEKISELMQIYKHELKSKFPKMYSHELINNLFCHPYTKVDFLQKDIGVSRVTAMKYLNQLVAADFLHKKRIGKYIFYINVPLFKLLSEN